MKKIFLLLLLTQIVSAVDNNFCTPLPDSKRYISNDFSKPYPREVSFTCIYQCKTQNEVYNVEALSEITVRSISDDARLVVCQGVKVKAVPWGYDFDGVRDFFAHDTKLIELKKWAETQKIQLISSSSIELQNSLHKSLKQVIDSYKVAGTSGDSQVHKNFLCASKKIQTFKDSFQTRPSIIKDFIISKNRKDSSCEVLTSNVLRSLAGWLVPSTLR